MSYSGHARMWMAGVWVAVGRTRCTGLAPCHALPCGDTIEWMPWWPQTVGWWWCASQWWPRTVGWWWCTPWRACVVARGAIACVGCLLAAWCARVGCMLHISATLQRGWRTTPRTVHVGARGRACQRRNSAPRAPPMKRAAAAWSLVPLALPAALRRRPRSMDQVCSSSPPLVSARDCLLGCG